MRRLGLLAVTFALLVAGVVAVVMQRSVDGRPLGTTQPIATGTGVRLDPSPQAARSFDVPPGKSRSGHVAVMTRPGAEHMAQSRVRFRVVLTLDLREVVPLAGRPFKEITVSAASESRTEFPFELPPLEEGRHCLVVTMLEPIDRDGLDHSMATLISLRVGEGPQRCTAAQAAQAEIASRSVAIGGCYTP